MLLFLVPVFATSVAYFHSLYDYKAKVSSRTGPQKINILGAHPCARTHVVLIRHETVLINIVNTVTLLTIIK